MYIILYITILTITLLLGIYISKNINIKKNTFKKILFIFIIFFIILSVYMFFIIGKVNTILESKALNSKKINESENIFSNKDTIIIGTTAYYKPWSYKNKNNNLIGFQNEIISDVAKIINKKIIFKVLLPNKLQEELNLDKIDLISDFNTILFPKNDRSYLYSIDYASIPIVFFSKKDLVKFGNIDDLMKMITSKKIAVQSNTQFEKYLKIHFNKGIKIHAYNSSNKVIYSVEKGFSDLGLTDLISLLTYEKNYNIYNITYYRPFILTDNSNNLIDTNISFIINKNNLELKKLIDNALNILLKNGSISRISVKYFKYDISS